jgi:hypothetical protein
MLNGDDGRKLPAKILGNKNSERRGNKNKDQLPIVSLEET